MGIICNDNVGKRVFRDSEYPFCASIAPEQNRSTFSVLMGTTMAELVNLKRF